MSYNISPRWKPIKSETPQTLGPNQYYLDQKFVKTNRYPFLSNTKQSSSMCRTLYTHAIYDAACTSKIIGGSALQNKAERKCLVPKEGPGPADYDPKFIPKKSPRIIPTPVKGHRLYVCNVPYSLAAVGPSIPTKIDENGYYLDSKNRLVKVPADDHDATIGPAFYDVRTDPCWTTMHYRGCKWSQRTALRDVEYDTAGPGPGVYDISQQRVLNERDEYRAMARQFSYVPRFLDFQEKQLLREDIPGPGTYDIEVKKRPKALSMNPAGFLSRSKRNMYKISDIPGPTKYDVRNSLLRSTISKKAVPFNVKRKRFSQITSLKTPGPGKYDIPGPIEEKLQRNMSHMTGQTPAFNITAEREMTYFKKDLLLPSPSDYTVEKLEADKGTCDNSVFRSVKERFPPPKYQKCAEPATYSVCEPFNKNRNRKSHNVGDVPFQSNHPRCQTYKPYTFFTPSPADYAKDVVEENYRGYYFNTVDRFQEPDDTPGPGYYMIHPSHEESMYKAMGTYNLRLKENVLHSKLRLPPRETYSAWNRERKKPKNLRAFYKPPAKISSWLNLD